MEGRPKSVGSTTYLFGSDSFVPVLWGSRSTGHHGLVPDRTGRSVLRPGVCGVQERPVDTGARDGARDHLGDRTHLRVSVEVLNGTLTWGTGPPVPTTAVQHVVPRGVTLSPTCVYVRVSLVVRSGPVLCPVGGSSTRLRGRRGPEGSREVPSLQQARGGCQPRSLVSRGPTLRPGTQIGRQRKRTPVHRTDEGETRGVDGDGSTIEVYVGPRRGRPGSPPGVVTCQGTSGQLWSLRRTDHRPATTGVVVGVTRRPVSEGRVGCPGPPSSRPH